MQANQSAVVLANARTHTAESICGARWQWPSQNETLGLWVLAFARTTMGRHRDRYQTASLLCQRGNPGPGVRLWIAASLALLAIVQ
jgi:hypothetical protein